MLLRHHRALHTMPRALYRDVHVPVPETHRRAALDDPALSDPQLLQRELEAERARVRDLTRQIFRTARLSESTTRVSDLKWDLYTSRFETGIDSTLEGGL